MIDIHPQKSTESLEYSYVCGKLIFNRSAKGIKLGKHIIFNKWNGLGTIGYPYAKREINLKFYIM